MRQNWAQWTTRQHSETSSYKANATMSEVLTLKAEGRMSEKAYSATVLVDKLAKNMSATLQQAEGNVPRGCMLAKDQPNPGVCDLPGMEVVL